MQKNPGTSQVLALASDVSADECDGSQLMQSGFERKGGKGHPDRSPEALKDLANRLLEAKQDAGNCMGNCMGNWLALDGMLRCFLHVV